MPIKKGPALTQKADSWTDSAHTVACIEALKEWDEVHEAGLSPNEGERPEKCEPYFCCFRVINIVWKIEKAVIAVGRIWSDCCFLRI
jgi:hypothetical protein